MVNVTHPYTGKMNCVSLHPDDVTAVVFWSKNYEPLIAHLLELSSRYRMVFHYTITGLPRHIEPDIPDWNHSVDRFIEISGQFSPQHLIWRYDPILFTREFDEQYHIEQFERIAQRLKGYTVRCVTSFMQRYAKNDRLMHPLYSTLIDDPFRKVELARKLAVIARAYGIVLYACCCPVMRDAGLPQAHCIDKKQIELIAGTDISYLKRTPSRKGCGCYASIDIGSYSTCRGGCIYCYAR